MPHSAISPLRRARKMVGKPIISTRSRLGAGDVLSHSAVLMPSASCARMCTSCVCQGSASRPKTGQAPALARAKSADTFQSRIKGALRSLPVALALLLITGLNGLAAAADPALSGELLVRLRSAGALGPWLVNYELGLTSQSSARRRFWHLERDLDGDTACCRYRGLGACAKSAHDPGCSCATAQQDRRHVVRREIAPSRRCRGFAEPSAGSDDLLLILFLFPRKIL